MTIKIAIFIGSVPHRVQVAKRAWLEANPYAAEWTIQPAPSAPTG